MSVKANLLKIMFRNENYINETSIFDYSIDPSEQYFSTILNIIRSHPKKTELIETHPEYFETLLIMILSTRYAFRSKILEIFKEILFDKLEEEDYNFNLIGLIYQVATAKINLETERVQLNEIEKLMNIFRQKDIPLLLQRIYLRFLISMFRVKFTPYYETVQKALGELLVKYHDTLMDEFNEIMESFDYLLMIGPNDQIAAEVLYPNLEEAALPKYRSFVILDVQNGEENPDTIDNRFSTTINVYQNLMKSLGLAIKDLPKETQSNVTKKFMKFMEEEFLIYHTEFSKIKGIQVENKNSGLHSKNSMTKLVSYLEILQDVKDIKPTLNLLLSINEASTQLLVLKQLFKIEPTLKKFEKSIVVFNSDTEFKDEVVKFKFTSETMTEKEKDILLPYIIRILNTKLLKKKGKANRKSLETKRTIVYRFLSSLSKEDLKIFIAQVIEPFGLSIEDVKDQEILEAKLSNSSFSQYLAYVSTVEGIVKQMGSLIQDYLPILCKVLTTIFKLSKAFYYSSKETQGSIDQIEIEEEGAEETKEEAKETNLIEDYESQLDPLKRNTLNNCRITLGRIFKRINEIYEKYFYNKYIKGDFSQDVQKIYLDNIDNLHTQNISSKSALMMTFVTWSKHLDLHGLFLQFGVIDELCKIVGVNKDIVHHEVISLIFTIFKNIVISSVNMDNDEVDKRDMIINMFRKDNEEMDMTDTSNSDSIMIISTKYDIMIGAISQFLHNNWEIIKNGVLNKKKVESQKDKIDKFVQIGLTKAQVYRASGFVKNIVFILSELSVYVNIDQKDKLEKLTDMFIPLLTMKGFMTNGKEDLINYTLKTVERLCQKMPSLITIKRYYMISKLLSENIRLSSREYLCNLLAITPKGSIKKSISYIRNMNKIRKGLATAQLDLDKAINS